MKTGIELIAEERHRQLEVEGWTPEHDSEHTDNSIAKAAACYATPSEYRNIGNCTESVFPALWPWDLKWWKPTPDNRVKELVKAGALIAAEIDRIENIKNNINTK